MTEGTVAAATSWLDGLWVSSNKCQSGAAIYPDESMMAERSPEAKTKQSIRVQGTSSNAAVVTFKRQLVKNETSKKKKKKTKERKKKRRCYLPYWKLSSSKYDWTLFEVHLHCPPLFFFFCFPCLISSVRKLLTLACCHPAVTALIQTIVWSAQMEPCPHFFFLPLRRQQRHGVTHTFHRHNRSEDEGDISHHRRHLSTRVGHLLQARHKGPCPVCSGQIAPCSCAVC